MMHAAVGRKVFATAGALGVALLIAGILVPGVSGSSALWPFLMVAAGLTLIVAGGFGAATLSRPHRFGYE